MRQEAYGLLCWGLGFDSKYSTSQKSLKLFFIVLALVTLKLDGVACDMTGFFFIENISPGKIVTALLTCVYVNLTTWPGGTRYNVTWIRWSSWRKIAQSLQPPWARTRSQRRPCTSSLIATRCWHCRGFLHRYVFTICSYMPLLKAKKMYWTSKIWSVKFVHCGDRFSWNMFFCFFSVLVFFFLFSK